ncbi:MAG: methyltransferase domain-containing protein [Candidatus Omnitrophota bacterium]
MKIFDFKLRQYDADYYKIYDRALTRDLDTIPSFRLIKEYLALKPGETLLDAGCGAGHQLNYLLRDVNATGLGVDSSETAATLAVQRFPGRKFFRQDLRRLEFGDYTVDKIVCFNVIEHIAEQDDVMREFLRVLKPGGSLVIGTNIRDSLAWKLYQLTIGEHTHVREFTVNEFIEFLGQFFVVANYKRSSGVFRFGPPLSWVFHHVLLGDVIALCKKPHEGISVKR